MAVYLLAYDMEGEASADFQKLSEELASFDSIKIQMSIWLITLSDKYSEIDVKNHFKHFIASEGRLWVSKVQKGEFSYTYAINGTHKWLAMQSMI